MSDYFDSGLERPFLELVAGLIISIVISGLVSSGLIPYYSIWIYHLYNLYGMIRLIKEMSIWKIPYIAGWLVGAFILAYSGLLGIDFLIYLIPLVYLGFRFYKSIRP